MSSLTHLDEQGQIRMVDVSEKEKSFRVAMAFARVKFPETAFAVVLDDSNPKGELFATVRLAGIQAAKRTSGLIPLAHPVALTQVEVEIEASPEDCSLEIFVTVRARDATGVEMEAMTGASLAALTVYDMCKGLARGITVEQIKLLKKQGGKSGDWKASDAANQNVDF